MSSTSSSKVDEDFRDIKQLLDDVAARRIEPQPAAASVAEAVLASKDIEDAFEGFIGSILRNAEQSTANHEVFVELLACVAQLPPPRGQDGQQLTLGWMGKLWEDLPGLGPELRNEWNGPNEKYTWEARIRHWRNMNSFVAHMTKTGVDILFYNIYCIWTLREALESLIDDANLKDLEWQIPGAAAWIDVLGSEICKWDKTFPDNYGGGNPAQGGKLWHGVPGFCAGRWALWRRQFGAVAVNPDLDAATREVAARAAAQMIEIDTNLTGSSSQVI